MAIRLTGNIGMLVLALWLMLSGLAGLVTLPLPPAMMSLLALVAGVLILVRR